LHAEPCFSFCKLGSNLLNHSLHSTCQFLPLNGKIAVKSIFRTAI
jgi:hypothetical protein